MMNTKKITELTEKITWKVCSHDNIFSLLHSLCIVFISKVIQRRGDYGEPREDFYRNWADYKHGFGDHDKEFWLGNDQIHELTKSGDMKLRIELEAHDGRTAWAEYDNFR